MGLTSCKYIMSLSMQKNNSNHLGPVQVRALQLFDKGFGYKSIAQQLGLERNDVRDWIRANKMTRSRLPNTPLARLRESVMSKYNGFGVDAKKNQSKKIEIYIEEFEEAFSKPRVAFENGTDSLLKVAEKYGVNYNEFRDFLRIYHPESRLLHAYAISRDRLSKEVSMEVDRIQKRGEAILVQLSDELSKQLAKINR